MRFHEMQIANLFQFWTSQYLDSAGVQDVQEKIKLKKNQSTVSAFRHDLGLAVPDPPANKAGLGKYKEDLISPACS